MTWVSMKLKMLLTRCRTLLAADKDFIGRFKVAKIQFYIIYAYINLHNIDSP